MVSFDTPASDRVVVRGGISGEVSQGSAGCGGEFGVGRHGIARARGEGVVGVVGDREGLVGAGDGVAHDVVVAAGAQQDPDGGGVAFRHAEVGVDPADVEAELSEVLGGELADL